MCALLSAADNEPFDALADSGCSTSRSMEGPSLLGGVIGSSRPGTFVGGLGRMVPRDMSMDGGGTKERRDEASCMRLVGNIGN